MPLPGAVLGVVPPEGDSMIPSQPPPRALSCSSGVSRYDSENPYPEEIIICEPHHRYYNHWPGISSGIANTC